MSNHDARLQHSALREAAASDARTVQVCPLDLAFLLADLDTLRATTTKPAKGAYTPEFESAWDAYPTRPGNSKAAAFKAWKARITAGATAEEMLAGTVKYAAYCKAMKTEPSYVKQAATFYGPGEHFSADWTVPRGVSPDRRRAPTETDSEQAERRSRWGLTGLPGDDEPEAHHA